MGVLKKLKCDDGVAYLATAPADKYRHNYIVIHSTTPRFTVNEVGVTIMVPHALIDITSEELTEAMAAPVRNVGDKVSVELEILEVDHREVAYRTYKSGKHFWIHEGDIND